MRVLRQNLMTRGGLAITLGAGVEELARYERGEAQMSLATGARLAEAAVRVSQSDPETHRRALALRSQIVATRIRGWDDVAAVECADAAVVERAVTACAGAIRT